MEYAQTKMKNELIQFQLVYFKYDIYIGEILLCLGILHGFAFIYKVESVYY